MNWEFSLDINLNINQAIGKLQRRGVTRRLDFFNKDIRLRRVADIVKRDVLESPVIHRIRTDRCDSEASPIGDDLSPSELIGVLAVGDQFGDAILTHSVGVVTPEMHRVENFMPGTQAETPTAMGSAVSDLTQPAIQAAERI